MYQIIVVNPGSTSTKVAVFEDEKIVFETNISHSAEKLGQYKEIVDQLPYRREMILEILKEHNIDLTKTDAFSAICTGLLPMPAGVFEVNDIMYQHGSFGPGSKHPGNLGPMLAKDFAEEFEARAFVVDPSSADEFCEEARVTGLQDMFRTSRGHPLNQRAAARHCAEDMGKKYEEVNLIVAHLGGGISITLNEQGRMTDVVDSTRGEGRMAPTRSGALPVANVIDLCFSGEFTKAELYARVMKKGGWTEHLGTSDAREVEKMIGEGNQYAELIYRATAYQIAKDIGALSTVVKGKLDGIVFTGGIAHSKMFVDMIKDRVAFLAPCYVYPGEFEMEALAKGALRVLRGEETPQSYTGEPVFKGFKK